MIDIQDYGMAKEHNPKSKELYNFISDLDFANGDFFVLNLAVTETTENV